MKYGYVAYANLRPEWFEKMDELPAEMDRLKEHAEKHGFHMKYWGGIPTEYQRTLWSCSSLKKTLVHGRK